MRQYAGYATAEESNKRYRFLLEQGQTGLSVAFDLPTQLGLDSDDPRAVGEVGKVGVAIDSIEDMEQLFEEIPLDKVTTSMTINATASILLAMYLVVAEKQGVAFEKVRGTTQNDILKEYAARGTYIYPPQGSMRLITDLFRFCREKAPSWNTISISGYHMREAGCTAAQEIAFTVSNAKSYIRAALDAGLKVDDFAPRLSFFFACHNNFAEEVAKFRAARQIYARIMRDEFGAKLPESQMLRFHTQTAGVTLTAQQPLNNIVRVALQALAAVCGGTQSLHTNSFDEALGLPTQQAVEVALRTQQIIAYESGAADSADPLGGSYLVEYLTEQLIERASGLIRKIDDFGGSVKAIESGFIQREIAEASYAEQLRIEEGRQIVVGVNKFEIEEQQHPEILVVSEEARERQCQKLRDLRSQRNRLEYQEAMAALEKAAATPDAPLLERILDAVRAKATVGEISDVFRRQFGVQVPLAIY
jgi:methylmalonyl-CoA mutase N-terminal domain/subunit